MRNPLERALIFLGYVRGPHVDKWVDDQIQETHDYIRNNVDPDCDWHEHIWDHMINDFAGTFQDLMSKKRARSELNNLKMEKGDLDTYTTRFRHLAQMALYRETDTKLCEDYFKGLPTGLQRTMITMEPMDRYQVLGDWVEGGHQAPPKIYTTPSPFRNSHWQQEQPTTTLQTAVATRICQRPQCHGHFERARKRVRKIRGAEKGIIIG